jgi:hypothetical protein
MDKVIFQEVPEEKREQYVRDNCDEILEDFEYKRQFTEEEIEEMKTDLQDVLIGIDVLEEKFETLKVDHKSKLKPLKEKLRTTIISLREGAERVRGTAYGFRNFETNEYGVYSPDGVLVSIPRKLKPQEKQKTINMALREASNG